MRYQIIEMKPYLEVIENETQFESIEFRLWNNEVPNFLGWYVTNNLVLCKLSDHPIFYFIVSLVLEYNLNATVFCHNLWYARTYFYYSVNLDIDAKTITPFFRCDVKSHIHMYTIYFSVPSEVEF
jgi:hypothetical protein